MQKLIILTVLIAFTLALTPQDLLGKYTNGSQCQSTPCPRTYNGNYNFACPKAGNNGQITYDSYNNIYYVSFKTYNMFGSDSYFQAAFTQNNIIHDYQTGWGQVQIPLEGGYVLNMMPCYNGASTSDVCSSVGPSQLAVWKTKNGGQICEGCSFSMTWYSRSE